jgi:8-oxo-dGTP pyrophosphatase MutT (NUDIX family)
MKCTKYDVGFLWDYKFVVTFANYGGKWILCKHRDRETWETSGGHIESGESPEEAAKRELYEETGSLDFEIEPVCDYWACDEPHETRDVGWSNGAVFLARVRSIGPIPDSEMEAVGFFDELPPNLTYPDITHAIFPRALAKIKARDYEPDAADLRLSDIMDMQRRLQDKHKGKWTPLTPDYGRTCLLWMIEELGELISIIKKRGETYIMADPAIRESFVEEFADVLMFMNDAMLCYGVSASEFSAAFIKKHGRNMTRDWVKEENDFGDSLRAGR